MRGLTDRSSPPDCVFQKSLCMTAEEACELVALAESAGVIHGVSFVYRQFAMVQQAAAMMPTAMSGGCLRCTAAIWRLDAAGDRP